MTEQRTYEPFWIRRYPINYLVTSNLNKNKLMAKLESYPSTVGSMAAGKTTEYEKQRELLYNSETGDRQANWTEPVPIFNDPTEGILKESPVTPNKRLTLNEFLISMDEREKEMHNVLNDIHSRLNLFNLEPVLEKNVAKTEEPKDTIFALCRSIANQQVINRDMLRYVLERLNKYL